MQKIIAFQEKLDHSIQSVWSAEAYLPALVAEAVSIAENMQEVGDIASQNLEIGDAKQASFTNHLIHFEWAEQAKNFLILWRDILFEAQKAALLLQDGKVEAAALADLKSRSLETIRAASAELKKFPEKRLAEIRSARNGEKKQLGKWLLQTGPWPKYREQLATLAGQCSELDERYAKSLEVSAAMQNLRQLINETAAFCQRDLEDFKAIAGQAVEFVQANIAEPNKVGSYLETLEADLKMTSYASPFTLALDEKIAALIEKLQVPMSTNGGLVLHREITFRRRTRLWLESEILPLLYEDWELTERTGNSLKMSLVNIRNRVILLSKNEGENIDDGFDICQPLHIFSKNAETAEEELNALNALLFNRLENTFEFSALYRQEAEFLSVPFQSTLEQMKLDGNPLLVRTQDWLQRQAYRLRKVRKEAVQESVLSISEKIVRYVQENTPDADNSHYSNIFLTKGYVGESFVVGREDEMAHVRKIVDNWRLGFRGAVILSGRRFAGKSLFGELVVNRHFIGQAIRLSPNAILQVQGRSMTTTTDLDKALSFIEKNTIGEHKAIWLDDLELWADANIPLSQNVRRLCRSIDSHSDRLFFLVSMSTWLRAHLHRFHELSRVFQAEVNLDRMSAAEIRQAILIRHGAAHRLLVDAEGKEVSPQYFQQMTSRVFKSTDGNIGDALNRWSASTHRVNEEQVLHEPGPGNTLPDFLTPDSTILLRTIFLEKRTNEYRLRKIFGPAFKDKYSGILQRLLRTGLLTRQMDGWLEVNEFAGNDVGKMVFGE